MNAKKRLHPMMIFTSLVGTLKSYLIFIIYLFVLKAGDSSLWVRILQAAFIAGVLLKIVHLYLKWRKTTYEVQGNGIAFQEGVFQKKERFIAFDRIQNVQKNKPFYLNMLGLVSIKLETGAEGEGADLGFPALKEKDAEIIEDALDVAKSAGFAEQGEVIQGTAEDEERHDKRITHFTSTGKDILKASFLSFSYFAFIPVGLALISNARDFINVEKYEKGFMDLFFSSWKVMSAIVLGLLIFMVVVGLMTTYIRYGNSMISSDSKRIYLKSGVFSVRQFSIRKNQVQAVKIDQSLFKRLLGLSSVELVTAGGLDEEMEGSSTLYPFLPADQAAQIVSELLPAFAVKKESVMEQLPRKSFVARLIRFPWLLLIGLAAAFIFYSEYWYVALLLIPFTVISRYLDYRYSRFLIDGEFVQLQTGGWTTQIAIISRSRVIELSVKQSFWKMPFGLSTLQTTSRGKPINVQELSDIPDRWAEEAYGWYAERSPVIDQS